MCLKFSLPLKSTFFDTFCSSWQKGNSPYSILPIIPIPFHNQRTPTFSPTDTSSDVGTTKNISFCVIYKNSGGHEGRPCRNIYLPRSAVTS